MNCEGRPSVPAAAQEIPGWPGDIQEGSALDFSGLLDGPAGKYGQLITAGGKFVFVQAPERPMRFYGVNLSMGANFLDKESCQRLADRLASSGYNSVRIHHHDRALTETGELRATELDPVKMDQLDFLFHCCKQRGIYLSTDLYVSRFPREILPELGRPVTNWEEFKFLIPLSETARKNWQDFSRNFLEHINPYTGLAWKDDPALITLSMVNEDAIYHCYQNAGADVRAVFDRCFANWLAKKELMPESVERTVALRNLFLFETCRQSFSRMRSFVRALGCRTLITDQNHWSIIPMALLRQPCDYVDDHFYWDHPENFKLPSRLRNTSCLSDLAAIFSGVLPGRCFGKPYTISEFNWVYPNLHRGESAPIVAAYAALQDWDGLYRYSYAHSAAVADGRLPAGYFDIAADPINMLSDRIGILLFLRGDVRSSTLKIPFAVSSGHMEEENPVNIYPGQAWKLGFVAQIGTVVESQGKLDLPPGAAACIGVDDALHLVAEEAVVSGRLSDSARESALRGLCDFGLGVMNLHGGIVRSSTGELEIHENGGTFQISTPRSEVVVFAQEGRLDGPVLSVKAFGPVVVSASSLDGTALRESGRILVIHLGDALHEGTKFSGNIVEEWGEKAQFVVGRSQASLTFRFGRPAAMVRIWALDLSGKRIREIDFLRKGADLTFTADSLEDGVPRFLYEIIRE